MSIAPKTLEPRLAVSGQIGPQDIAAIAAAGYRALICNRPDGEAAEQAGAEQMAAAAAAAGLPFRFIPVVGSAIDDAAIAAFRAALTELPLPIFAYCRSGNRCTLLWALAEAGQRPLSDIEARAQAAGYDITPLRSRLLSAAGDPT